eukprot:931256-Heterocapsa_arctica.AAC.1
MPCVARNSNPVSPTRRVKIGGEDPAYNAMVARLLTAKEIAEDPDAQQAILTEGGNLEKQGTWDLSSVTEKWDLIRDAKAKGDNPHRTRVSYMFRTGQ